MTDQLPEGSSARRRRFIFYLPIVSAIAMLATNRWFTAVDDECALIDKTFQPLGYTVSLFVNGQGQHRHPPLFDIAMHFWLILTHANYHLLRLPFIVLYTLSTYALARAAKYLAGAKSEAWTLGMAALCPYGFHYGRVAAWYCFCFAVICFLTLAYFRFVDKPLISRWIWLVVATLAAVYSNYVCWVLVFFLAVDFCLRYRQELWRWRLRILGTVLTILLFYYPILHVFIYVLHADGVVHFSPLSTLAFTVYNLFCTFVSESVGPWFWFLGIPAGIGIAIFMCLSLWLSPWPTKRFFLYYLGTFGALAIAGIDEPKHLVLVEPWILLALGATIGTVAAGNFRRVLIGSMLVPVLIGWFGIVDRNYYGAPHWVEPWQQLAKESVDTVRNGGIVIGNNPSYFFYLTYLLPADNPAGSGRIRGLLPTSVRHANVFTGAQWLQEGHPLAPKVVFVTGMHYFIPGEPDVETGEILGTECKLDSDTRMVHDVGAVWKRRFSPKIDPLEWRIRVRVFSCP